MDSKLDNATGSSRTIRVFISSTFHDLQAERDLLVKRVFPELRLALRDRAIDLIDVDLRWGITADQAERGELLRACLAEIDRCRPFFIGLLGSRYGSVPAKNTMDRRLFVEHPWLASSEGASITEIEIMHGVLNPRSPARRAFFYFRAVDSDGSTVAQKGTDDKPAPDAAAGKLAALKQRIRAVGAPLLDGYRDLDELGARVRSDILAAIDAIYPPEQTPDARILDSLSHAAYARDRLRFYLAGAVEDASLDDWIGDPAKPPMLVSGESGVGKSALLANFAARRCERAPADVIFEHYVGSGPETNLPADLLRRLMREIEWQTGQRVEVSTEKLGLADAFSICFAAAGAHAAANNCNWILVIDGLDALAEQDDLRWLPTILPERVRLIASSRGDSSSFMEAVFDHVTGLTRSEAAATGYADEGDYSGARSEFPATNAWRRRRWNEVQIARLDEARQRALIVAAVARHGKAIDPRLLAKILAHPLANLPLFLATLVDELRVFGDFQQLDSRLAWYLASDSVPALFARVLERLEEDCRPDLVGAAMSLIWAGRAGLEESEIVPLLGGPPVQWASLRLEANEILRERNGRIVFGHDYLRSAVEHRYLASDLSKRAVHRAIASRFAARDLGERQAEELAWQLRGAEAWTELEALLTDLHRFAALHARGDTALLAHWQPLKARGRDPASLLLTAWFDQFPGAEHLTSEHLRLGGEVGHFLSIAGGRGAQLVRLHEQLLAGQRRLLGEHHRETLRAWYQLGSALEINGWRGEAEDVLRFTQEAQSRILGSDDIDTAKTEVCLARLRLTMRDFWGTEEKLGPAISVLERKQGADSQDTLIAIDCLADALAAQADFKQAELLRKRVLETAERVFGPGHGFTLQAKQKMIGSLLDRGDLVGAKYAARDVLEALERIVGLDHPWTFQAMITLATTRFVLAEWNDARKVLAAAIEGSKRILGNDHPDTLNALQDLAARQTQVGHFSEAEPMLQNIATARTRVLGPEHPDTLETMQCLADALLHLGRAEDAIALSEKVLPAFVRLYGDDHANTDRIQVIWASAKRARSEEKAESEVPAPSKGFAHSLGIAFDIDALVTESYRGPANWHGFYGYVAYRCLFDNFSPDLLRSTRWRDGDTRQALAGKERVYLVRIEANDPHQIGLLRCKAQALQHPALLPGDRRFVEGETLEAEPLVVAVSMDARGVPAWAAGGGFPLAAWNDGREGREAAVHS